MFARNFPYFSLYPLPLEFSAGHTSKSLALSSSLILTSYLNIFIKAPQPFLLQAEQLQFSQLLLTWHIFQTINHLSSPLLSCFQCVYISPVLGRPEPDIALQISHQDWVEGNNHLPQCAGKVLPNATQEAVNILCHKIMFLANGQLGDPQAFATKLLSSWRELACTG